MSKTWHRAMCCAPKILAMHDTSLRHQIDATLFASQELQFHFLPLWTEVALPKQMNSQMFLWQKALFLCKLHIFRTARRISRSIARWRHMLRTTVGHIFCELAYFPATETISLRHRYMHWEMAQLTLHINKDNWSSPFQSSAARGWSLCEKKSGNN